MTVSILLAALLVAANAAVWLAGTYSSNSATTPINLVAEYGLTPAASPPWALFTAIFVEGHFKALI